MAYPKRYRRMLLLAVCGIFFVLGAWVIMRALEQNSQFFYNAADVVAADFSPESDPFRVGGLVMEGTVEKTGLTTRFRVEDFERDMTAPLSVTYQGALPDLFREGQGVVVSGSFIAPGEISAKDKLRRRKIGDERLGRCGAASSFACLS